MLVYTATWPEVPITLAKAARRGVHAWGECAVLRKGGWARQHGHWRSITVTPGSTDSVGAGADRPGSCAGVSRPPGWGRMRRSVHGTGRGPPGHGICAARGG